MGLIVKYQLEFPETGLKVSNDLWKGEFIIDADISVEMFRRASGSKFTIKMYDLPNEKGEDLHKKLKDGLHIKIKLGYFDGPFELVMEGVVNKIHSLVQNNKLITSINLSSAGWRGVIGGKLSRNGFALPRVSCPRSICLSTHSFLQATGC